MTGGLSGQTCSRCLTVEEQGGVTVGYIKSIGRRKKKKIGPYLYCQYLQIWKQPSRRQTLNLVPREVEFSQSRQEQAEAFEIIVTQIQHLYRIK